jgi:nucleotide-binding universal stress UspA family protein
VLPLRQIVVPVDFTDTSESALDYAIELAKNFKGELAIVHAYEIPVYALPEGAYITAAQVAAQIATAAQGRLDALVESRRAANVPITAYLRNGIAWEEINDLAAERKADLIVIGTHGRRGLARALLGSVAENVIRTSNVPVLVIHGPRDHESQSGKK